MKKLLLVDFENVQRIDLSRLGENFHVIIFVGSNQKNVPIDLVATAQKLGGRVEWQRVEGIACHLGRVIEKSPSLNCVILSKDEGFDPLLKELNNKGLKCNRIDSLLELEQKPAVAEEPIFKSVFELLGKSDKKSRPRKRKTLSQHISSMFQKNISHGDVDRIVDILFANKLISEKNNVIIYSF